MIKLLRQRRSFDPQATLPRRSIAFWITIANSWRRFAYKEQVVIDHRQVLKSMILRHAGAILTQTLNQNTALLTTIRAGTAR